MWTSTELDQEVAPSAVVIGQLLGLDLFRLDLIYNDGLPQPNPDDAGPIVCHPMGQSQPDVIQPVQLY